MLDSGAGLLIEIPTEENAAQPVVGMPGVRSVDTAAAVRHPDIHQDDIGLATGRLRRCFVGRTGGRECPHRGVCAKADD